MRGFTLPFSVRNHAINDKTMWLY